MEINWLRLHVSNVCNFSCPHCHVYSYNQPDIDDKLMPLSVFVESVERFTSVLRRSGSDCTRISIYGGEPFVNKRVICEGLQTLGRVQNGIKLDWVINTNGSLIEDTHIDIIRQFDVEIHLSIDGKEAIHNQSRRTLGGKDTFARVLTTLKRLRQAGVRVQLNSHVMPSNIEHLNSLIELAREHDVQKVYLDLSFSPLGMDVSKTLKHYRATYYEGLKRGVFISGSWGEVLRNSCKGIDRRSAIRHHIGIEVNVDGTYFFPTRVGSKAARRQITDMETNLLAEIRAIRAETEADYDNSCSDCSLFKKCYGVAKEHVFYHLSAGANPSTYCEFFRQWLNEVDQPVRFFKLDPFLITTTGDHQGEYLSQLQINLNAAAADLRANFPILWSKKNGPIPVHVARDFAELSALAGSLEIPAWTGLFARAGRLVLTGGKDHPLESLKHEMMHVLFQRASVKLPAWFEEGVCQLVAGSKEPLGELDIDMAAKLMSAPGDTPLIHICDAPISANPFYNHAYLLILRFLKVKFKSNIPELYAFIDHLADRTRESIEFDLTRAQNNLT